MGRGGAPVHGEGNPIRSAVGRGGGDEPHAAAGDFTAGSVSRAGVHAMGRRLAELHFTSSRFNGSLLPRRLLRVVFLPEFLGGLVDSGIGLTPENRAAASATGSNRGKTFQLR